MNQNILVSVVVVTYNSSNFVFKTLESIKEQTYKNIELIITDDASTDDTIDIVKEWIEKNKERFLKIRIVTNHFNTGVTPNINRGIQVCTGKFIKPLAGDDLLVNTCIQHSLDFCVENRYEVIYSRAKIFTDPINIKLEKKIALYDEINYDIFQCNAKKQHRILHTGFPMYTIGLFFSRKLIESINYFDEKYKMMEDYPFAFKLTGAGHKLNLLDSYEVEYRIRTNSSTAKFKNSKRKKNHDDSLYNFQNAVLIPSLRKNKMWVQMIDIYVSRISLSIRGYSNNKLVQLLGIMVSYLSILKIKIRVKMIVIYLKSKISYVQE